MARNVFASLFRSASIASSYDLLTYLMRGAQSLSGSVVNEATAFSVGAVMSCVSIRSRSVGSTPLKVFERLDARSKRPAVEHSLSAVLRKPNGWQTGFELKGMLEAHRVLRGNAYAWINRVTNPMAPADDREQIAELIPMHPDRVEVDQPSDLGGPILYKLHRKNGRTIDLPQSEVLHLRGLTTDGVKGRAVLQDARDLIGTALAAQEHAAITWQKGGMPYIALSHPKVLSDKAKKGIEESFQDTYGTSREKRRVAVLEEGMTIEKLSLSPQDLQFLETRKFLRSEIAGWFHVPPHMIGDVERSTSWGTGIEQQQIGFAVFALRPDLVAWEQRLTMDLIQNTDKYFVEFNLDGLLRGDAASRSAYYTRMVQIGAFSPNDVRAFENMNPYDGGDVYFRQTNTTAVGDGTTQGNTGAGTGPAEGDASA
jgi:HK97 family phage portal protein